MLYYYRRGSMDALVGVSLAGLIGLLCAAVCWALSGALKHMVF
jgi:hypothetical protein